LTAPVDAPVARARVKRAPPKERRKLPPPAARIAAIEEATAATRKRANSDYAEVANAGFEHTADALQYADDVLSGAIPACKWVKLACKRHARDLSRIGRAGFRFRFDPAIAERVLVAVQKFREVKGPRAGQYLKLEPWQKFVIASAFGWVDEAGNRRFRYVLCYVPRGNGKTTLAAPLGLFMLALDNEGGSEVYAAAVTRQQARLVFDTAQFMARKEPHFRGKFGVDVSTHSISQQSSVSMFRPLSRDASSLDGLNVHFAILDELAQHKSREVHDVLLTATGKRSQAMMFAITTAGSNQSSIGHEQWEYAQKVLSGSVEDDQFFAVLYTIDKDDDWTSPESWRKANPNWGVSVMPDVIERLCKRAQSVASQQNAFKQKHLNVWTSADVSWMNMQAWNACADPSLKVEQFEGESCVIGLDLAAKIDLAAKVRLFRREIDGAWHYYVFCDSFLPQAAIDDGRNDSYGTWQGDGWITTTPGEVLDFNAVQASVLDDAGRFSVVDVAYDPWQALQMASALQNEGVPVIEYRPNVANFSPPMKEVDALVRERRLHHDGNPVLAWCVSCVRVREDEKGNIYPRKDKGDPKVKIDGLVALLMALGRQMTIDGTESPPEMLLT
jgi:phage terminase large subunit-like protein